jgi:hypothetical protein
LLRFINPYSEVLASDGKMEGKMMIPQERSTKRKRGLFKLLELAREGRRRSYKKILRALSDEGLNQYQASVILAQLIEKGILRRKGIYYHKLIYEIDTEKLEEELSKE